MAYKHHILGIDPGLTRCGWALLQINPNNPTEKKYAHSGTWQTQPIKGETIWKRAQELYTLIDQSLDDWGRSDLLVTRAAVEEAVWGGRQGNQNASTARGVIACALKEWAIYDITDMKPTEAKRRTTGNGRAEKKEVRRTLENLLAPEWRTKHEDESDALSIAYAAWQQNTAGLD